MFQLVADSHCLSSSPGDVSSPTGESPGVCSVRRRAAWKPGRGERERGDKINAFKISRVTKLQMTYTQTEENCWVSIFFFAKIVVLWQLSGLALGTKSPRHCTCTIWFKMVGLFIPKTLDQQSVV